jgi:[NiFe] hydrogenase assembly HybE family chaperone
MVTPWAINLIALPGTGAGWPETRAGGRHLWSLASETTNFTVAEEDRLGFTTSVRCSRRPSNSGHAQARLTARAAVQAVHGAPLDVPAPAARPTGRRAFLGLGR